MDFYSFFATAGTLQYSYTEEQLRQSSFNAGFSAAVISVLATALVSALIAKYVFRYLQNRTHTVYFHGLEKTVSVKHNTLLIMEDPTKEGYSFDGWYLSPDYSVVFNPNQPITKDVYLYAKWTKIN